MPRVSPAALAAACLLIIPTLAPTPASAHARHGQAGAERVTIRIEDDGEGFAPDILQRIGDPYVTRRNPQAKAGGLGLGLFIAKTLLERSGAVISIRNAPEADTGAVITITWPRSVLEEAVVN